MSDIRKALVSEIQALTPHEVKCRCGRSDTFTWPSHLPECPRYQVGSMLDSFNASFERATLNTPAPEQSQASLKPIELARSLGIQLWTPVYHKGKGVGMKKTEDGFYVDLGDLPKLADQIPSEDKTGPGDSLLTKGQVIEKLLSEPAIHALYGVAPNLVTDNDAGPDDEESAQLREAVEAAFEAAFGDTQPEPEIPTYTPVTQPEHPSEEAK
jgi:hypothetical protein